MTRDEYEQAFVETRKHKPFRAYWDDAITAAILGKLGRIDEARPYVEAARKQKPDLAHRAGELMRRSLKIDPLIDDLVDGLRLAGLATSSEDRISAKADLPPIRTSARRACLGKPDR
jgi:hypothetical protein